MGSYNAAIEMIIYEGKIIWTSFRSLLETNMFLITLSGVVYKFFPDFYLLLPILPICGIILCIVWLLITLRQFDFYKCWHAWARHNEATSQGNIQPMILTGKNYSDGDTVTFGG